MADNPFDININLNAERLGIELENALEAQLAAAEDAVATAINAAYASIVARVQSQLHSTRDDYLKALKIDQVGRNEWVIYLDGEFANQLESGSPATDMKDAMLSSKSLVSAGPRQGQPWVQKGAKGQKFAHVPLSHNPNAVGGYAQHLGGIMKNLKAPNAAGLQQKLTSVFRDAGGNPIEGRVAQIKGTGIKDLENLIKYQKVYTTKTGSKRVESIYHTYRTVSENSKAGSWMHPGHPGLHAFDKARAMLEQEIDNILKTILG